MDGVANKHFNFLSLMFKTTLFKHQSSYNISRTFSSCAADAAGGEGAAVAAAGAREPTGDRQLGQERALEGTKDADERARVAEPVREAG